MIHPTPAPHPFMVVLMLTRVTKPLMGLLLMARMMHGRLHMVHELILLLVLVLLLLLVLVIHGGLTMVVTVIVTSAAVIHMT